MLSSFKSPPVGMVLKFEQHSSSPLLLDRRPESGPSPIALIVYQNAICYSMVGRMGGEQNLSLATDCDQMGIVIHEFMHALGFWHEQSRMDRDDYVTIRWENISPDRLHWCRESKLGVILYRTGLHPMQKTNCGSGVPLCSEGRIEKFSTGCHPCSN
ncbi:UNVERIFIED_CONTAM: nas-15 [Trichonephila clavipes]